MVRPRTWWRIQLIYLSVLLLAALAAFPLAPRATEEKRALAAALRFEEAVSEGNWPVVWASTTEKFRRRTRSRISARFFHGRTGMEKPNNEFDQFARLTGITIDAFRAMTDRERFLKVNAYFYRRRAGPDALDDPLEFLGSLFGRGTHRDRVESASRRGNHAHVEFAWDNQGQWWFQRDAVLILTRAPDERSWLVHDTAPYNWGWGRERVIPIRLSRIPSAERSDDFVVELGREPHNDLEPGLLTAALGSRAVKGHRVRTVLIEADESVSFQRLIDVLDAVRAADIREINFTDTQGRGIEPGIRINGVRLDRINPDTGAPSSEGHPALKRAFSVDPR